MKSWLCAERVYGRDIAAPFEEAEDSCLNVQWSLPSSTNGNVKATTLTTFVAPPPYDSYAKPTTYLIIAVRGSASTVDQLINLHGEPRDADTLFVSLQRRRKDHYLTISLARLR